MKFFPPVRFSLLFSPAAKCLAALGLTGFVQAQQAAPAPVREGSVWKISDQDSTVYLAGSVHLLREEDYPLSPVYDEAYADSLEVVFEVDMAEMMSPAGMAKMQQLGVYTDGDTLGRHLKQETIGKIRKYLDTHEMGKMMALGLDQMKPGMIFLAISSLEAMRMNAKPELGLETVYFTKAKQDMKPTRGLETIEFQMSRFDELTDDELDALLNQTLKDVDKMAKVLDELIGHWHSGDAEKLDKLLNEEMEASGERLKELLLTERNANWVPEIEKALEGKKNVIFIVGAGHLVGEDGVVEMLRKKGHTVEKVKPSGKVAPAKPELKKAA